MLALINRKAYADLVQGTTIDIAMSPAHAVIGELLAYVRRGDVEAVHSLRRGAAEALEAVVRGDAGSCRLAGRRVEQIDLATRRADRRHRARPARAGRYRHGRQARRRRARSHSCRTTTRVILTGDRVIVFMPSKKQVREVEKLFQVSATFFG